jgi:pimeloyl-ACP methyl ester carboxylesterase
MAMPCLVFVGKADPRLAGARESVKGIRNATFFSLPECGHAAALGRRDLVLPHVVAFLSRNR